MSPRLDFVTSFCFALPWFVIACGTKDQGALQSGGAAGSGGVTSGGTASGGAPASGGNATGGAATGGSATGGMASGGASGAAGGGAGTAGSAGSTGGALTGPCIPPAKLDAPLEKLSQTGCMDPTNPTKFASFVVPYEVNSPLWSDSADKERGMVVPAGRKVHVKDCAKEPTTCVGTADTGQWVFPVGTVLLKNFGFDGKVVETRLFVRFDETKWAGYSYQWDEAQTEALIVPDEERTIMFDTGQQSVPWSYPSRKNCDTCHQKNAGFSLGPQTAQLNRTVGGKNQLDTLQGLLDAPLATPYQTALVTPYPSQAGTPPASATLEQRARSYLHANCANCHRPDGEFQDQDYRYDVPLKDSKVCNAEPVKGSAGVPGALILVPGSPDLSLIWLRMGTLETRMRMPQLATHQVDEQGLELIGDWIGSLTDCPP